MHRVWQEWVCLCKTRVRVYTPWYSRVEFWSLPNNGPRLMNESWRPLHIASSSGDIIWKAAHEVSQSWRIISRWHSWWISKSYPRLKQGGFGLDCSNLSNQKSPINWARPILSQMHSQGADPKFKLNPRNKTRSNSSIDYVQLKAKKQKIQDFFCSNIVYGCGESSAQDRARGTEG